MKKGENIVAGKIGCGDSSDDVKNRLFQDRGDDTRQESNCIENAVNNSFNESMEITAVSYDNTGGVGYEFFYQNKKIFEIAYSVFINLTVTLRAPGIELEHKDYDPAITIVPGVRRIITDTEGKYAGHFKLLEYNHFEILSEYSRADVYLLPTGWIVVNEQHVFAYVRREEEERRERDIEDWLEKEKRFNYQIFSACPKELYPFIFAIPVLGF